MNTTKPKKWKAGDKVVVVALSPEPDAFMVPGDVYNVHAVDHHPETMEPRAILFNLARPAPLLAMDPNVLDRAPQVAGRFRSVDVAVYVHKGTTTYVCENEEIQDCLLSVTRRGFA